MTRARDVKELIHEQATSPDERRALDSVADAVEGALSKDVPYRPEFKAQLRNRLMAQAQHQLAPTPWFRRPAVWGSGLAVAAAAAALAIGLQLMAPPSPGPTVKDPGPAPSPSIPAAPRPVAFFELPAVAVADEAVAPDARPEEMAGFDWQKGVTVFTLTIRQDAAQLAAAARALGMADGVGVGFRAVEGTRTLELTADGRLLFKDEAVEPAGAPAPDKPRAIAMARRFLDQAGLPVPSAEPVVTDGGAPNRVAVTYAFRVDGRPVVNGSTRVVVSSSRVLAVNAAVAAPEKAGGPFTATDPAAAAKTAQARGGGRFEAATDLVYVRAMVGQTVYLLPYWRTFGAPDVGGRVARYVPAWVAR